MKTFKERLLHCLEKGHMAGGDLKHWFDRPYATTGTWLRHGREPQSTPAGDEVRRRLVLLEEAITAGDGFPIPVTLTSQERPLHIKKLFNALNRTGVSRKRAAR